MRAGTSKSISQGERSKPDQAGSEEVHEAFVAQFFHHLVKQPIRAYGKGRLAELRGYFAQHDCNIQMLAVEIIAETAWRPREEKAIKTGAR